MDRNRLVLLATEKRITVTYPSIQITCLDTWSVIIFQHGTCMRIIWVRISVCEQPNRTVIVRRCRQGVELYWLSVQPVDLHLQHQYSQLPIIHRIISSVIREASTNFRTTTQRYGGLNLWAMFQWQDNAVATNWTPSHMDTPCVTWTFDRRQEPSTVTTALLSLYLNFSISSMCMRMFVQNWPIDEISRSGWCSAFAQQEPPV